MTATNIFYNFVGFKYNPPALSCDTDESEFFSGEPPLSYSVEKRRTSEIWRSVSQLSALATLRPIWGRVGQGGFELSLPQIKK